MTTSVYRYRILTISYPIGLSLTTSGKAMVVIAPIMKVQTVNVLRPIKSYKKPTTRTVGQANAYPYVMLFVATYFALFLS